MCISYNDVLKRLRGERQRLALSQKEMSQRVRMNQSNYSKVELGLRRLSFYELKYLCESGVDVHYIYTAQKSSGEFTALLEKCNYSELMCLLDIIYAIVAFSYRKEHSEFWRDILEKVKYVPLLEGSQDGDNMFLLIRRSVNYQQKKMADTLGIDVKKLRELENGRSLPDSELLSRLYELFSVPPAPILRDKKSMASQISVFLEAMDERNKEIIFDIAKTIYENK